MNCPYINMDCTEIDTSGMTKLTDCNDCVHRYRMWNKTIPQKLYLFWDGSPMSWLQMLTVTSFHKYNPTWTIYVYEPNVTYRQLAKNTYIPDYTGKDWYPKLRELEYVKFVNFNLSEYGIKPDSHGIQCSDQWRARILYENGGMYSDFDVLWLKPMSKFVDIECIGNPKDFEALVSFSKVTSGYHSNSNLIAEAGSPFMKSVIDLQRAVRPPYEHQAYYNSLVNKEYKSMDAVLSRFPRVLGVKYNTFFPYGLYDLKRLFNKMDLGPIYNKDVMAVHWYNGAGESKDYINKQDYFRSCSMTEILRTEGWFDEIKR